MEDHPPRASVGAMRSQHVKRRKLQQLAKKRDGGAQPSWRIPRQSTVVLRHKPAECRWPQSRGVVGCESKELGARGHSSVDTNRVP